MLKTWSEHKRVRPNLPRHPSGLIPRFSDQQAREPIDEKIVISVHSIHVCPRLLLHYLPGASENLNSVEKQKRTGSRQNEDQLPSLEPSRGHTENGWS